jgi:hypothetical protein
MKFFGYENHRPSKEGIETEIEINLLLKGISGVAQLLGVFNDTEEGLRKSHSPLQAEISSLINFFLPLPSLSSVESLSEKEIP